MTEIVQHKGITIANTLIATDAEGRFRLNDLHQAAGGERRHGPSLWLENEQTKALAQELSDTGIPVSVIKGGSHQGTAALTGVNMLQLMDRTHLATPSQEIYYTPTELGSRFVKSGKAFNQLLVQAGLQESIAGHWVPTEKGREHAYVMDTGKAHASGTPIQQVKWRDSVLAEVAL